MGLFDTIKKAFTQDNSKKARNQKSSGFTTRSDYAKQSKETFDKFKDSFTTKVHQGENPVVPSNSDFYDFQSKYGKTPVQRGLADTFKAKEDPLSKGKPTQTQAPVNNGYRYGSGSQFGDFTKDARKIYEDTLPQTMVDYANNAAIRDTTRDANEQKFYNERTLDQDLHDNITGWGQMVLSDQDAVTDWILEGGSDEECNRRIKMVEDYMERCFHSVPAYDPDTHAYTTVSQISLDAELPPWVQGNNTNSNWWDYYKTYAHGVVKSTSDAYRAARDEGRLQQRNPYKSAFSTSEAPGAVNSFLDVIVSSIGSDDPNAFQKNVSTYWNEYIKNPFKAGRLKTVAGNALFNMMETMDFAARGVRAFTAGDVALGGAGGKEFKNSNSALDDYYAQTWEKYGLEPSDEYKRNKYHGQWIRNNDAKFKGQNVYWVSLPDKSQEEIERAQTLFMDKGGYALLMMAHPDAASKADLGTLRGKSREELIRELDEAFKDSDIDWRDIYNDIDQNYYTDNKPVSDLKHGFTNIQKAYTDVDANFNADTGNLAADMIIETVLDPGLIAGGIAKSGAKATVSNVAEEAVTNGFSAILRDTDDARRLVNNPNVRRALNSFIGSNEGKNIIFKDFKNFDEDIDLLINRIGKESPIFSTSAARDTFKKQLKYDLMETATHKNSLIMESVAPARKALDSKSFKAMYALDKSIDFIDSAIIKSSFFVPWAGVKGAKAGFKTVMNSETAGRVLAKMQLKKNRAANAILSAKTGAIDLTRTEEVFRLQQEGAINETAVRYAMGSLIDQYDQVAFDINGIINKLVSGAIDDEAALRAVGDIIDINTGGSYKSVEELAGYVDALAVKYAGDIKAAYMRVDDTFKRLQNAIDYKAKGELDEFEHLRAKEIYEGINAVGGASAKSIKRSISMEQFDEMLLNIGINWKDTLMSSVFEAATGGSIEVDPAAKKLSNFMEAWSEQPEVTYTIQDALKFIDRLERQCQFKMLLKPELPSEISALAAHKMVGQFNALRKQLKKIDVINLRDAKVVTLLHTDRVALLDEFTHNSDIQTMYGAFYDDVIAPIRKELRGKTTDEVELYNSSLFADIDLLARQKYGFDRTDSLVNELKNLSGFTDDQIWSAISSLGSMFNSRNEMGEVMLYPGSVRNKLNAALRSSTGESKVGKKGIMDALQSVDSDNPSPFLQSYFKEFEDNPELRKLYDKYAFQDALDPAGDVERQMLFTALADPTFIPEMNDLASRGQAMAFHINSTGLNSEINEMTSIAFRKWVPIEVTDENPLTLERLLDAFESQETVVFQRGMTDEELAEGLSENVLRRLDIKDTTKAGMLDYYKQFYGITDARPHMSERELVESVCSFLRENTNVIDGAEGLDFIPPSLVAHDMDGFNMKYFTDRVNAYRMTANNNSSTAYYADYISNLVNQNAKNTYKRCADRVGEIAYTDEQIDTLTRLIEDYVDDINYHAKGYRFNDMRTYSDTLRRIVDSLEYKKDAKETTELEDLFLELYSNNRGSELWSNYVTALKNITDLTIEPRGWAFVSQDNDNLIKAALDATGRRTVNVDTRIYVDDVLSYFNLETEDGFLVNVEDLQKMHAMSKYIRRMRDKQIVNGAEEFLASYKADYDRIIQSCIDISRQNSWESTQLAYLQNIRIPDNAIDSFLMAKKLYNDHLKYWLDTDELTSLRTDSKQLDAMKLKLNSVANEFGFEDPKYLLENKRVFEQACDYVNTHRTRFLDELTGGFDSYRASIVDDMVQKAMDDKAEYWRSVSEDVKEVWSDFKIENEAHWSLVSADAKDDWRAFKAGGKDRWQKLSKRIKQRYANLKEANKDAKEAMLKANEADWSEKYGVFKEFLDERYQPAFDAIDAGFEAFRAAKKEKWDYFFNDIKPERDRLDQLIKKKQAVAKTQADIDEINYLITQRRNINAEWQAYNLNYMVEWFDDVKRKKVFEGYRFKDKKLQEQYDILKRVSDTNNKLYETRHEQKYALAAQAAEREMCKLAVKADNFGNKRKGWLEWHGNHILSEVQKALTEEYIKAKHGTLDIEHSILIGDDDEFKALYKQYVANGFSLDAVKSSTQERYLDYRAGFEPRFEAVKLENEIDYINTQLDSEEAYSQFIERQGEKFNEARIKSEEMYEEARLNSALRYREAKIEYENFLTKHLEEDYDTLDSYQFDLFKASEDSLAILEGAHEPEIFKWAARSDYEKKILRYKDGVLRDGIDKATRLTEANSEINSNLRQLRHMDEYYASVGLSKKEDILTASTHMKTKQLFDILDESGFLKRESFHTFMSKASELHKLKLQKYRFDNIMVGSISERRNKLLSDLVYNGFNMTVFNSHNYSVKEASELRKFVKELQKNGDDFLSYYEDKSTGNIFIYLNNNCTVAEQGKFRFINGIERFERPLHDVISHPEFEELKTLLDLEDIDDYEGVYHHLLSCWEDTRLLSYGGINGTTGRTVSRIQAEEFMASLPSNMNDWLTSEGLLKHELSRDVVYDPGFVINDESDMLMDFLGTLHRQADVAKDDCILINEIMHNNDGLNINTLSEHFTDDELIDYFGDNPDYVVCAIVRADETASGFQVRQINLNNKAALQAVKENQNTTILPYNVYYEIAEYMNRSADDNIAKRLLGKYMLAYKAFALVKPGTWMRNYLDATLKASLDNGEDATNVLRLINYQGKAVDHIGVYGKLLNADPELLKEANWDMVQRVFKTDMTYEEFELLKGVMDGNRFKSADKYFLNKTARARNNMNVISGTDVGLRNLEEKDIKKAFKKYLSKEADLPLKEKEFMDIYFKNIVPDETMTEQYEYMFRKLSNNLHNANAGNIFDKTIDNMFKPFSAVENTVRYAQTMYLFDQGFSQNQTLRHIHATQFYNAPSWGMWHKLEYVVPFITFKYNNIMYWIRMMDENPRYFRYFEDLYGKVMNTTLEDALDNGQEMDYESDYGLQSGGISFDSVEHYLNVGNSFLSAMNDFYDIPHDFSSLNPLLRDTVRGSFYMLGLNSHRFFSTVDLDMSDESLEQSLLAAVPGYSLGKSGVRLFRNLDKISTENGGPTMDSIYSTLNFLGVLGVRYFYGKNGKFDMDAYQEELAAQGQWYDCNLGKVVDISQKNEFGANDPNNSFEDVQAYMLTHFGKIWDANQHKFVSFEDYQEGGYNDGFDFENDPEAWEKLCDYMRKNGKLWDYNQRKFVRSSEYISGGLNNSNLDWNEKIRLMEEKFPNLKWDANQNSFVELQNYIAGGLNDISGLEGQEFLQHWNELRSLRLALYGETYDKASRSFIKTSEPSIVLSSSLIDKSLEDKYENYYSLLGVSRINISSENLHMNEEGLLVTSDGKYVITGNAEYDRKVFDKFRTTLGYTRGGGRRYYGHRNYAYNKSSTPKKPYHGRTSPATYLTGYGWNDQYGYYREAFEYSYQYHSPQPGAKLNRLISPPKFYPYGGQYGKYSFQNRY